MMHPVPPWLLIELVALALVLGWVSGATWSVMRFKRALRKPSNEEDVR